jgi:hypothetical protein
VEKKKEVRYGFKDLDSVKLEDVLHVPSATPSPAKQSPFLMALLLSPPLDVA